MNAIVSNYERLLCNQRRLFAFLLCYRVVNALLLQTAFVPDEFWQSIEVAHKWTFGYGSLTWEWSPETAIRSPVHPLLIAAVYRIASLCGLSSPLFIRLAPRVLHGILAALVDLHIYQLARRLSGPVVAKWTLFHQLINWFTFYCGPRTLSNSLEWALTTIGLTHYPWHLFLPGPPLTHDKVSGKAHNGMLFFLWIAVISALLRPTAVIIWIPLCLLHILHHVGLFGCSSSSKRSIDTRRRNSRLQSILQRYMLIGGTCVLVSCLLDRWSYGRWTVNQWNFLRFNLIGAGALAYGVHPAHWYLSQGLPAMLWTQLPIMLYGLWIVYRHQNSSAASPRVDKIIGLIGAWTLFSYSLLGHKEFRFIFPLLPVAMYFCSLATVHLLGNGTETRVPSNPKEPQRRLYLLLWALVASQALLGLYTGLIHQRGTLDAVNALQKVLHNPKNGSAHVLVLMPCHSVPSVGYLHLPHVTMRQLACEPDLSTWSDTPYYDEAEQFYADPKYWLEEHYNPTNPVTPIQADYIVLFDHLLLAYASVHELLFDQWSYRECGRYFHATLLSHRRHGHYVVTLCRHGDSNMRL